jgi:hypothetical protein
LEVPVHSTDVAITFFTFLTVLANLATLGIMAVAGLARGPWPVARRGWLPLRRELAADGVTIAWLVATVCTGGSLWFSEVAGFVPCRLCWVQRACMYPLVVVLALVGLGWRRARPVALVLAGCGAVVATYHVLLEHFPSLDSGTCDPAVPCTLVWFERWGFITLPYMALSGFVFIITLLLASRPSPSSPRRLDDDNSIDEEDPVPPLPFRTPSSSRERTP